MRIYIANLGKYNEGELVGAWFTPPVDYDEMAERIGLNQRYEEYAIHDYELPFEIDEYTPIEEVNRLCEMVEDLPEYIQEELSELQSYFGSIEELCEHEDDILCHSGCDDMADVARYYLEENGQLGEKHIEVGAVIFKDIQYILRDIPEINNDVAFILVFCELLGNETLANAPCSVNQQSCRSAASLLPRNEVVINLPLQHTDSSCLSKSCCFP